MANASIDQNRTKTFIGVSKNDFSAPTTVAVDPNTHELLTQTSIDAGDIEIGAVEIKDGASDQRATVNSDGSVSVKEISPITGFATSAKQDTGNSSLSSIDTKLTSQATAAKQDTGNSSLSSIDTKLTSQATAANQTTQTTLLGGIAGLVPAAYDYISLSYTGSNLTTVVFKTGGSGGTTVATLTLSYTGSQLDSVTKT